MSVAAPPQLPQHPDPFDTTGDPLRYVPRPAMERVLAELVQCAEQEGCLAVLPGAPGTGKTLLLRLLAQRLAPRLRCVVLPYAALPAPALCAWALDLLGESASYDPVGAIVGHARRADAPGLVLLVDNAESIAPDTARELARAADAAGGGLRLVAASEESGLRLLEVTWPGADRVSPIGPMSAEETATYLAAHLGGLAPEIVERAGFDAAFVAELHRASGGVPARVNAMASQHLLRAVRGAPRRAPRSAAQPAESAAPAAAAPPPARSLAGASPRLPEPPPLPPPPEWAREEAESQEPPPPRAPTPEARPAPAPSAAEAEESALERAAGRLALAHSPGGHEAGGESLEPGFERAVGRLALSESENESFGVEPGSGAQTGVAEAPQPAAAPAAPRTATAPRPAPGRQSSRRLARASAVLGVAFAVGIGASLLWLRDQPLAPPAGEAPSAAQPSPAQVAPPPPPAAQPAIDPAAEPAPEPVVEAAQTPLPPVDVRINATPWATIRVDGREVGVTPLSGVELSPGPHVFEARLPDGRVLSRELRVDAENRFVVFP